MPVDKIATFRNALFTWKSPHPTAVYYYHINQYNHVRWAKQKLIPTLLPNFVAVLDNASQYNVKLNKLRVLGFLTREDGTDTLSRNVGKQLPQDAA
jgi:hypothetical protein